MSNRQSTTLIAALSALFASAAFSAPASVPQPETPGSLGPQMVAESIHKARVHGIRGTPQQPAAQAAGSVEAQQAAEAIHLRKSHGVVNDSADQRMLRDASRL